MKKKKAPRTGSLSSSRRDLGRGSDVLASIQGVESVGTQRGVDILVSGLAENNVGVRCGVLEHVGLGDDEKDLPSRSGGRRPKRNARFSR